MKKNTTVAEPTGYFRSLFILTLLELPRVKIEYSKKIKAGIRRLAAGKS